MSSTPSIDIPRGGTWSMIIQWTDENGSPINSAGLVSSVEARIEDADCSEVMLPTVTDVDLVTGQWKLSLTAIQTAELPEFAVSKLAIKMNMTDGSTNKWPEAIVNGVGCP